jgi:hypothetical protein
MTNDEYCENCGGECDGCCGGTNKMFATKEEQAKDIVKIIMSHGLHMANLVLTELKKQMLAEDRS